MIENAATEQIAMKRRSPGRFALLTMALVVAFGVAAFLIAGCGDNLSAAKAAELAGDLKTAERLYQERLQVHPDDLGAIKGIAGVLYLERKWTEALPYQEKAVARDAREAQIRVELGFNYLNHQSSPQKALVVFQEASTIEPTAQHMSFLAQAQLVLGDARGAEQTLRKAVATDGSYPYAYMMLISLLEQQGRAAEASELRTTAEREGISLESPATTP